MRPLLRRLATALLFLAFVPSAALAQPTSADDPAGPEALLVAGDLDAAAAAYEEMRAADPVAADVGLARVAIASEDWGRAGRLLDGVLKDAPDHVDAHFWRAVVHRELAKFHVLFGIPEWRAAEDAFEWVIARDSLHRDVLYQFALLRRYGEAYRAAVELGETQLRLRPELADARAGLYTLYRLYSRHTDPAEALDYLSGQASGPAAYARADLLRRLGRLADADAAFRDLLVSGRVPATAALLGRARVLYALGQPERAEPLVTRAIASVDGPFAASILYDDFKYIFNDAELARYRSLTEPAAVQAFYNAFWARRNPTPAAPLNPRLQEHYRRLDHAEANYAHDGLRFWNNDPDKLRELSFPDVYYLNDAFNDKGLIYIRYGEPDDRIATVAGEANGFRTPTGDAAGLHRLPKEQSLDAGWVPNQSWRYHGPGLDFHFVIDEGGGVDDWRLTPALTNYEMIQDRSAWGGVYARLASIAREVVKERERVAGTLSEGDREIMLREDTPEEQGGGGRFEEESVNPGTLERPKLFALPSATATRSTMDLMAFREEMVEQSRLAVETGLGTDRHTWSEEVLPLEVPHLTAAFRGADGETSLEVHFALPIGRLTREADAGRGTVDVEVGCALYGLDWQPVAAQTDEKKMPPVPDEDAAALDFCRLTAPPDSYRVAFHNRPVQTDRLGGARFELRLPDFSGDALALSDILPATDIRPATGGSRYDRGALYVQANPFARFAVEQPLYLYFEVYNLTYGADDRTAYAIEYVLTPRDGGGGLFRRRDRVALSLRTERDGAERSPREYAELDVSQVDPGRYDLAVRVTDTQTGAVVERVREILLVK